MEQTVEQQPFSFTGRGDEYFRIWIVNLCLSLLTLGIYSAWAKVRRLQYFYRHTAVAGAGFDYHGDPMAILKGRILAVVMLVLYTAAGQFSIAAGLAVFALIMAMMPWLMVRSLRFQMHNASYRGLRFSFHGKVGEAYVNFLLLPVLAYVTLGLLLPLVHQQITRYIRDNSRYGDLEFKLHASGGAFYGPYVRLFLISMGAVIAGVGLVAVLARNNQFAGAPEGGMLAVVLFGLGYVALMAFAVPYLSGRLQNVIWNGTTLGPHAFAANVRVRELFWVMVSNVALIVLTLGLFKPFADVRLTRYRVEHVQLRPAESLETVLAQPHGEVNAAGEEMTDLFDMEVAL